MLIYAEARQLTWYYQNPTIETSRFGKCMADNNAAINGPTAGSGTEVKPKIRIVVADDHPIFRDGLCKLLALEEDFEVVAQAQDGRQVLDVLQQHEPDI